MERNTVIIYYVLLFILIASTSNLASGQQPC